MYLPLAGINPDADRVKKMKINAMPPISLQKAVQPVDATDQTHQRLEKINQEKLEVPQRANSEEASISDVEEQHWSPPAMSTQDFVSLRQMGGASQASNEDQFKVLDEVIARMKEQIEVQGDALEAIKKMKEQADPDNVALQLLVKTLEAMDSNAKE